MYKNEYFQVPPQDFSKKQIGNKVDVYCSISYNGGTVVSDKWYAGFEVSDPILPPGTKLISDHSGMQLNAHPPFVTMTIGAI